MPFLGYKMLFYIAALIAGAMRWPWWTLAMILVARVIWLFLVDLPAVNAWRTPLGEPPIGLVDETIVISLSSSLLLTIVLYVVGRGVRAFLGRTK